jgi:hypothetical protein
VGALSRYSQAAPWNEDVSLSLVRCIGDCRCRRRLQARCTDMAEIGAELGTQLPHASRSVAQAALLR